jgi:hypothetical protein
MADFFAQVIDEFKALGAWCMIHGPEIWLGLAAWCVISIAVVIGMWLGALLGANKEDKYDEQ